MLSLSSPLWLLALSTIPLVWWLHRFYERHQSHLVAASFLWELEESDGGRDRLGQRVQPVWLLRAMAAGLMVLALADPQWDSHNRGALTVWVDDSPSMFTLEAGGSRMEQALLELNHRLEETSFSSITLRSLGAPGEVLALTESAMDSRATQMHDWEKVPRGEPAPPLPALMDSAMTHWLLSDGVSPGLVEWVQRAPLSHLISVGSTGENVAITALSLRHNAAGGQGVQLLITVVNGGQEHVARRLLISAGGQPLTKLPLSIAAGDSAQYVLPLAKLPAAPLRASISEGDALTLDDYLELPAAKIRRISVHVPDDCGQYIRAALAAHPGLRIRDSVAGPADLEIQCKGEDSESAGAVIRLAGKSGFRPVFGDPFWHPGKGSLSKLALDPAWLAVSYEATSLAGGTVLLDAPEGPLIKIDADQSIIDIRLDMSSPQWVRRPEYPLLIAGLVNLLFEDRLGEGDLVASYNRGPVSIRPQLSVPDTLRGKENITLVSHGLAGGLIAAAVALLILDLLFVWWQHIGGFRGISREAGQP